MVAEERRGNQIDQSAAALLALPLLACTSTQHRSVSWWAQHLKGGTLSSARAPALPHHLHNRPQPHCVRAAAPGQQQRAAASSPRVRCRRTCHGRQAAASATAWAQRCAANARSGAWSASREHAARLVACCGRCTCSQVRPHTLLSPWPLVAACTPLPRSMLPAVPAAHACHVSPARHWQQQRGCCQRRGAG